MAGSARGGIGVEGAGPSGGSDRLAATGSGEGWYEVGAGRDLAKDSGPGFSVDVRGAWEDGVSPEKYGKMRSSKVRWREMITLRVERSKQRYPLCSREYPRKTHCEERGESLWGLVAIVLGKHKHPKTRM